MGMQLQNTKFSVISKKMELPCLLAWQFLFIQLFILILAFLEWIWS